jgi:hypothetical protein
MVVPERGEPRTKIGLTLIALELSRIANSLHRFD